MGEWIPTTEELPEEGKYVLLYFKEGITCLDAHYKNYPIGYLHDTGEKKIWCTDNCYYDFDEVIAWTPLPEPYTERKYSNGEIR